MNDSQRIDTIEIKITYLEDTVNTLNSVILEQNALIDALQNEIRLLKEKDSNTYDIRPNEKPPHY